ncbi:hypothetical protein HD806DRAFT_495731 [Xylariaceae sp. AK1471]|nr:hypothetical protein HD806DRAFT_495731 [Xylariaceae sp. AK1471]
MHRFSKFGAHFVKHAQMWVFAKTFTIDSLKTLVSSQLAHDLAEWNFAVCNHTQHYRELVHCLYANTTEESHLRQVVAHFAAYIYDDAVGLES